MGEISIVIPTLNEETTIRATLDHLTQSCPGCDIIVVDGGSTDQTVAIARTYARGLISPPGRARQMNAGAREATGDILWFIHADSSVDPDAMPAIQQVLTNPAVVGGGLRLAFDDPAWDLRLIAALSNLRARTLGWIFGDQSLFVRRSAFDAIGGFPDIALMEDLELSRRLRRRGHLALLSAVSRTSARRFRSGGPLRVFGQMQWLKLQYFCGVNPDALRQRYTPSVRRR